MRSPWQSLLDWWFGEDRTASAADVAAAKNGLWFGYRDSKDAEARERFGDLTEQALAGGLSEWTAEPHGWLALILLLDQLPRMIHRGTPHAFAGDVRSRELVRHGLEQHWEEALRPIEQVFVYLPLEHAEDRDSQTLSVERFRDLREASSVDEDELFAGFLDYAERHRAVIERFGRFPHRNAILGRETTEEEGVFLQGPGSRF
ncbi:DUF924 family protein [Pseudomonas indica]|uniref:Uncharacterized conserved protein, DUF924 family n=1 Tax=Pseudomonas indica TaxID=137658 RepID=A0A1G8SYW8_9PSED|nr:DUF924 family protein [Pseudomonas indica]SDJ34418.1 Uncharacterized conserved protein, DUF924 family [Pseudomonas indica]